MFTLKFKKTVPATIFRQYKNDGILMSSIGTDDVTLNYCSLDRLAVCFSGWDGKERAWEIITDDVAGFQGPKISDIGDQLFYTPSES